MKICASLIFATISVVAGFKPTPIIESVGVTPFSGKFDPLGLSEDVPNVEVARLRESELKHGRWAMISAVSIPLLETQSSEPAIHAYDKLPHSTQLGIAALILMGEFATVIRGYQNPFVNGSPSAFKLREDYQPGDLGFYIYTVTDSEEFKSLADKELINARVAMIGALGMILQELFTEKPLFHYIGL